jgi:hypothetical protein
MLIRNNFASFDLWKVGHGAPGRRRSNLGSFELGALEPICINKFWVHIAYILLGSNEKCNL